MLFNDNIDYIAVLRLDGTVYECLSNETLCYCSIN